MEGKSCPTFETLSRFLDGALDEASARQVAAHLDACDACVRALSEASAADALVPLSLPQKASTPCPLRLLPSDENFAHLAECASCRAR